MLIKFSNDLYNYFKTNNSAQVIRSTFFRMKDKEDQSKYQRLIQHFNKWIFYYRSYDFGGVLVNEIFFDLDRMLNEWSEHYGIKSGQEMMDNGLHDKKISSMVRSIENVINEALENLDKFANSPENDIFKKFVSDVNNNWNKSFVINCVPNILNGNYVNVPIEYVEVINENRSCFSDEEDYFFRYLNRLPIKINNITISDKEYCNIVNSSIVPLFITLDKYYILNRDN